jgi:hypothetical protein
MIYDEFNHIDMNPDNILVPFLSIIFPTGATKGQEPLINFLLVVLRPVWDRKMPPPVFTTAKVVAQGEDCK